MSHMTRDPMIYRGIGSKAIDDGHRHENARITKQPKEESA